jgi:hypothetical protein
MKKAPRTVGRYANKLTKYVRVCVCQTSPPAKKDRGRGVEGGRREPFPVCSVFSFWGRPLNTLELCAVQSDCVFTQWKGEEKERKERRYASTCSAVVPFASEVKQRRGGQQGGEGGENSEPRTECKVRKYAS